MKMDRKPKNTMLKAYDYSVMFYFSSDVFTLRVSSSMICPLQRIGIWRFKAAIGTIIIIIVYDTKIYKPDTTFDNYVVLRVKMYYM